NVRNLNRARLHPFVVSEDSQRAYAELLAVCRREGIAPVLLSMPDGFLAEHDAADRAAMDEFLSSLSRDHDVPLVDARDWAAAGEFAAGVHLPQGGAAPFAERLGREGVQPYLDGESLARRWPPGRLSAAAPARTAD